MVRINTNAEIIGYDLDDVIITLLEDYTTTFKHLTPYEGQVLCKGLDSFIYTGDPDLLRLVGIEVDDVKKFKQAIAARTASSLLTAITTHVKTFKGKSLDFQITKPLPTYIKF